MTTDSNPVLHPTDEKYVLPAPPRGQGGELVVGEPLPGIPTLRRGAIVARAIGERVHLQAESLQGFLVEVRERLQQLDAAIAEDSRAQLKGAVRELVGVIDWCDAVQGELASDSAKAVNGQEPIDLGDMCRQVARQCEQPSAAVSVFGEREVIWWGDCAALADLLGQALVIVAERTQGNGLRCLEVDHVDGVASIRVSSRGEPADSVDPDSVQRFRVAAERIGAQVVPDVLGPGGAGLVLRLPS